MTIRRLSFLQWFGFLAGGGVWFAEFIAGVGASEAACNPGSGRWHIPHDGIQLALMLFGVVMVVAAEAASIVVFLATRDVEEEDAPPQGRLHFFATAAMFANLVFLVIILLAGLATILDRACHQA
jgi:Mn2+/Fe2+ NRAMP family transporter